MRLFPKQLLAFLLAIVFVFGFSYLAQAETIAELGEAKGQINDYAKVLSQSEAEELEQQLAYFAQETSNELVVVTVNDLAGLPIEYYATELFAKWQIGQAGKDNGVLLLIAKNEGELRIEVGYGLEGAITDALSYQIVTQKIAPALTAGNYYQGIKAGLDSLMEASQGEYTAAEPARYNQGEKLFSFSIFLFIFVASLLNLLNLFWRYLAKSKSWWQGGVIGFFLGLLTATAFTQELIIVGVTAVISAILGFVADYLVSRVLPPPKPLPKSKSGGRGGGIWFIGGGGGGSSGGFGGFGGGRSGGGGFSGKF